MGAVEPGLAGRPVVELRVDGARALPEETILHHLGLELGSLYDPEALDGRLRALWSRGLLEDVTLAAEPAEGGVRVVVRVDERPLLAGVEYRGLERVRANEIAERLAGEGIRLEEGGSLDRGELRRLEIAVAELYRERGFELARVEVTLESAGDGRATAVVAVDEGDRLRTGEIVFEGNTVFSDARLRRALRESSGGPLSRLLGRGWFDRAALARDLEHAREVYLRAGYKDAAVGEARVESTQQESGRRVRITVPVEEGDRWKLGGVSFSGNRAFSDERLLALCERPRAPWLGSRFVDDVVERVRDLYGRGGYMTAEVEPVLVERGELTADLMVRIDEGARYRVGRIEIEGNIDTRDKVIRRELAVQEGAILDATALRRSLLRLGQLEFFELDEQEPVRFELDAEASRVDLTLRGREADPARFWFGGGYSQTYGLFGQIQYTSRNFRGRGETLSGSLQAGADLTQLQLGYTVPWLLDRRQSIGGELFLREETIAAGGERLRRELSGGRFRWSRRLGLFQSLSARYAFEDVLDARSRELAGGGSLTQLLDRQVSSLTLGWALDRVDSRLHPTRGLRLSGSLETAGGALGGDSRFLDARAALDLFRPLRGSRGGRRPGSVLGFHLEAGSIRPLGGDELSFAERFHRGGENSVRGFEPLSIQARGAEGEELVDADGFRLGGDRFLEAGLEYHLLLNRVLRLVAFADAGGVWAEGQAFDLSGLRQSAGLELRVTTPLFPEPLRFIFSENLDPLPGDRFDRFQFSFGASF